MCSASSVPALHSQHGHVVNLTNFRDRQRRGGRALAQRTQQRVRLDVHHDIRARQLALDRLLDRARHRVSVRDPRIRLDPDHHVREVLAARLAHPQATKTGVSCMFSIASRTAVCASSGGALSISTRTLPRINRPAANSTRPATSNAATESAPG